MAVSERHQVDIDLDSSGMQSQAGSAANALDKLNKEYIACNEAIRDQQKALADLRGAETPNIQLVKAQQDAIKKLRNERARLREEFTQKGGQASDLGKEAKKPSDATDRAKQLADELKRIGGPLGGVVGRIGEWSQLLKSVKTRMASAGAQQLLFRAGVLAAGAAVLYGVKRLRDLAVEYGNIRLAERLQLEGITTLGAGWQKLADDGVTVQQVLAHLGTGFRDAAAQGAALQQVIDLVSARTALGREQVIQYARELIEAGVRGKELQNALQAAADVGSVQGDAAAQSFLKLIKRVKDAGGSVDDLAKKFRDTFGVEASRQLLDAEVQANKTEDAMAFIFGGVDTSKLEEARKRITDVFSASTSTGQGLRRMWAGVTQGLVDLTTDWTDGIAIGLEWTIKHLTYFALDVEYAAIKVRTAFYQMRNLVVAGLEDMQKSLSDAGRNAVQGFVEGIKLLAEDPVKAIKEMGSEVVTALRSMLGIHSPSRVLKDLGMQTGAGFVAGIESQHAAARGAARELVDLPTLKRGVAKTQVLPAVGFRSAPLATGSAETSGSSSQPMVQVDNITITVEGGDSPTATAQAVYDVLLDRLQVVAKQEAAA